jgi:hypothetical protein
MRDDIRPSGLMTDVRRHCPVESSRMNPKAVDPVIPDTEIGERRTELLPRIGSGRLLHKPTYIFPGSF